MAWRSSTTARCAGVAAGGVLAVPSIGGGALHRTGQPGCASGICGSNRFLPRALSSSHLPPVLPGSAAPATSPSTLPPSVPQGLLSMANAGPDTNTSHFSILMAPAPHLDGHYTVFGEVVEGLDVSVGGGAGASGGEGEAGVCVEGRVEGRVEGGRGGNGKLWVGYGASSVKEEQPGQTRQYAGGAVVSAR